MFVWVCGRAYAALLTIATLLAFPVYVPAQTWREARDLSRQGRIHWSVGLLSVLTSTVTSLVFCAMGLFFAALTIIVPTIAFLVISGR